MPPPSLPLSLFFSFSFRVFPYEINHSQVSELSSCFSGLNSPLPNSFPAEKVARLQYSWRIPIGLSNTEREREREREREKVNKYERRNKLFRDVESLPSVKKGANGAGRETQSDTFQSNMYTRAAVSCCCCQCGAYGDDTIGFDALQHSFLLCFGLSQNWASLSSFPYSNILLLISFLFLSFLLYKLQHIWMSCWMH